MKNYWKGKLYLKFENSCPWYAKGPNHDICLKELIKIGKYRLTLRIKDTTEFKEKYKVKLLRIFDSLGVRGLAYKDGKTYYLNDMLWILKRIDHLETTPNWQVMHDVKNNSYIGYSHRGVCEFKIGDVLFDGKKLDKKVLHQFYADKKLRWKMLKSLLRYHFKNDVWAFEDVFEDELIGHGISLYIPFVNKGSKRIENDEECYQAACNFAKYIS